MSRFRPRGVRGIRTTVKLTDEELDLRDRLFEELNYWAPGKWVTISQALLVLDPALNPRDIEELVRHGCHTRGIWSPVATANDTMARRCGFKSVKHAREIISTVFSSKLWGHTGMGQAWGRASSRVYRVKATKAKLTEPVPPSGDDPLGLF